MTDPTTTNLIVQLIGSLSNLFGPILAGVIVTLLSTWGVRRMQKRNELKKRDATELNVIDRREERELKVESGLRAELMVRLEKSELKIEQLIYREDECKRKLLWMQQWLWTLHDALKDAGIHVNLPSELTLEGFEQPSIRAHGEV